MEPQIIERGKIKLVGLVFYGNPEHGDFGKTWERFGPHMDAIQNRVDKHEAYGVELYPPEFPDPNAWIYFAAVEVSSFEDVPHYMVMKELPASKYAVFTVTGGLGNIGKVFGYAYHEWLPKSGYEMILPFDLEFYDERFEKTNMEELYIYITIKEKAS